jgi:hypothetical protein
MFQSVYGAHEQALMDFNNLLSRGKRHRMMNALLGKANQLVTFETVREGSELRAQHDAGVQVVAVENIVGTVGRAHDFDDAFHPKHENSRHRWCDVAAAIYEGRELPPIELYLVGDDYYIIDGNHRISVMKSLGQEFVEAHVIKLELGDNRCQAEQAPRYDR